ncbi:histidinol-phosphate transaminase [Falsigemmobacter intermedius]|uniref:histidinol-phosphate transaminase n=1 Tax=Falsigemmobacter intermedius TaxID=1553448 RepID=UPI003F0B76F6
MSRFWSPAVHALEPYVPGEQPKGQSFIKLNTNENPYGPSPKALAAMAAAGGDALRLYPDPVAADLRRVIGRAFGLSADHVFAGNGSDEVLGHAFAAFFRDKGPVLFADVTYSFYPVWCDLHGIPYRRVATDADFNIHIADYTGECGGVILANPNAPTGIALPLIEVERLLRQHPDVVVLVDEAYVDFGADSAASLIAKYDNLLVVQTLSKSRSLAGLRVGFALGQPHLIEGLVRIKDSFNSYPLGRPALAGAAAAIEDRAWFDETRARVMADRGAMSAGLRELGFKVLPSQTNFIFASHPGRDAADLLAELRTRGILVRHFRSEKIRNWLRISVGTAEECQALVTAMGEILAA